MKEAKCAGNEQMRRDCYPEKETGRPSASSSYQEQITRAKRFCVGADDGIECPVLAQCQQHGMSEDFGVWGGLSADDRARLRGGITRAEAMRR